MIYLGEKLEYKVVMYSLRLRIRLNKIRRLKINCFKTKSDKWYFDYEIKTKTNEKSLSYTSLLIKYF
jgi:hypothetical protein